MPRGSVAENSSVRRVSGVVSRMNSISSRKPRSSISSASSSTTAFNSRDVETAAPQMIAQPARRADHDVGAGRQLALFAARDPCRRRRKPRAHRHIDRARRVRAAPAAQVRGSARRSAPAARRPARTVRHRRAGSARSPAHRRRSCRSRFAPKPAGRGRRRHRPAPRSAPASGIEIALGQGSGERRTCGQGCHEIRTLMGAAAPECRISLEPNGRGCRLEDAPGPMTRTI